MIDDGIVWNAPQPVSGNVFIVSMIGRFESGVDFVLYVVTRSVISSPPAVKTDLLRISATGAFSLRVLATQSCGECMRTMEPSIPPLLMALGTLHNRSPRAVATLLQIHPLL